jgi:hypothetical protein
MMPPRRLADNEAESAERFGLLSGVLARQSGFQENNHNNVYVFENGSDRFIFRMTSDRSPVANAADAPCKPGKFALQFHQSTSHRS